MPLATACSGRPWASGAGCARAARPRAVSVGYAGGAAGPRYGTRAERAAGPAIGVLLAAAILAFSGHGREPTRRGGARHAAGRIATALRPLVGRR